MKKFFVFILIFFNSLNLSFAGDLVDFVITVGGASVQAGVTITGVSIVAMDYESGGDGPVKQDYSGYVTLTASVGNCKVVSTGTNITGNFTNGQWTGSIILYGAASPVTITCIDSSGATGIAYKNVYPGPYARLLYLIKGMEHMPGTSNGFSGAPEPNYLVTYLPFSVTVLACDIYYNRVTNFAGVSSTYVTLNSFSVPKSLTPAGKDLRDADALGSFVFDMTIMPTPDKSDNYTIEVDDLINTWEAKFSRPLYFISQTEYYMWAEINGNAYPLTQTAYVIAGTPFDVTIKVAHSFGGSPIGGFNEPVNIKAIKIPGGEDGDPIYSGLVPLTNGVGYVSITYTTREKIKILPVYDNNYQGLYYVTKVASGPIEIMAAPPYSFTLSTDKEKLKKNETAIISAGVKDIYGNPVSMTAVDFIIKQGSGSLSAGTINTNYDGIASVIYTAPDANMENVIQAAVTINASVQTKEVKIVSSKSTTDKNVIKNYPNPFIAGKENTQIEYFLEKDSDIELKIFNMYGRVLWSKKIKKGENGARAGGNTIFWDGKADAGYLVGSGLYVLRIKVTNDDEKYIIERNIAIKK